METFRTAKAMPSAILFLKIGIILLVEALISNKLIFDATFYSRCFEGDLDGYVEYEDLADITVKKKFIVKLQLLFFSSIYMKNYSLKTVDGKEKIVLHSKTVTCQCQSCGAPVEKKIYFTGECPYCGSSDLFAKVISGDRFYSIKSDFSSVRNKPDYYTCKRLTSKKASSLIRLILALIVLAIFSMYLIDQIQKYNDHDYQVKILLSPDNHLKSFDLIKKDIMGNIIFAGTFVAAFLPISIFGILRTRAIITAETCSKKFGNYPKPYVNASDIPPETSNVKPARKLKKVKSSLRRGYLKNCSLEKNENIVRVALAIQVVKDKCPFCAAPITGVVNDNYKCSYCGNMIMGVVAKKTEN
jgi:Zn finger protein HypA/HybF involved in hydrogenase expression